MNIGERFERYIGSHSKREIIEDTLTTIASLGAAALIAKALEESWGERKWKKEER